MPKASTASGPGLTVAVIVVSHVRVVRESLSLALRTRASISALNDLPSASDLGIVLKTQGPAVLLWDGADLPLPDHVESLVAAGATQGVVVFGPRRIAEAFEAFRKGGAWGWSRRMRMSRRSSPLSRQSRAERHSSLRR